MTDYTPISCALHSEYELMAMHHQEVVLQLANSKEGISGRVVDMVTRDGVEYMVLVLNGGDKVEIRLDSIESVTAAK